ncbi:MAG TPA: acyl-CoA dehydrogenase family protein [Candidatus Bathyarchaeia archaeon]|nr:acyl-CoA dehydrogenase family protein [Candidatus Bathyarchaeia archaeon]
MTIGSFDPYLEPYLTRRVPTIAAYKERLADFHDWVATEVEAQANYTDRYAPPALETYDRDGEVVNRIVTNPWYEEQHREVYRRGIIGLPYAEAAPHLLTFTMGYILSQADISLDCPVTLTGSVAHVLAAHAPESVRRQYLHDVVRMDGLAKTGGTWATEQHGGSDVGATTTRAVRNGDRFALHGLKWFTSNANSGLAIATARPEGAPEGSAGLGLYLVPSHLDDGKPNRYRIRRLKDKLGTKGLPTGEIDLLGAEAVEIAAPPHGFKLMMEALEYSRVHNAVGSAGMQCRALREALAWAKSRRAFGHLLCEYPMVQDELLRLRVEFEAGALLAFEAAIAFDEAQKDPARRTWLRLATALAKYLTAEYAVTASRAALELIGGNGYTSDYPVARLLRDAQVLTIWEGPANIQALELLRLLAPAQGGCEQYRARVNEIAERIPPSHERLRAALQQRIRADDDAIAATLRDAQSAQRLARKLLHRLSQTLAFALLCEAASPSSTQPTHPNIANEWGSRDIRQAHSAWRYFEQIEPQSFGAEDEVTRRTILEVLDIGG